MTNLGVTMVKRLFHRVDREWRKYPALVQATARVGAVWDKLVAAFCEEIQPIFARFVPDTRLVATVTEDGGITLHEIAKTGVAALGALPLSKEDAPEAFGKRKWSGIELRLRPDQALQRTLTLPAASRDFLKPIIEHRLERLTPWRVEKVLYGYRIIDKPPATAGSVTVALLAASKDVVERLVRQMTAAGLRPTRIGIGGAAIDQPMVANLDVRDGGRDNGLPRQIVSRAALGVLGFLLLLLVVTGLWSADASNDEATMGVKLTKARVLMRRAAAANPDDREGMMLAAKDPDKAIVVFIDRLSAAIPSDTYLKELAITADKVHLSGISANAPALVGTLETAGLANVRFTAAVTRGKDLRDNFEIVADRRPMKAPAKEALR